MEKEILEILSDKKAHNAVEIIAMLDLDKSKDNLVMDKLNEMTKNYELYCTKKGKYMLFSESEEANKYKKGKFIDTQNDYGFVDVGKDLDDIFIHGSNVNGAINGDTVLVEIMKNSKNDKKSEGRIVKILGHDIKSKVGEVYHFKGQLMVQLDDKKFKKLIVITGDRKEVSRLVDGDKILVSFGEQLKPKKDHGRNKDTNDYIYAKFERRIGHINDPDIDILSIIADNGFNVEFPNDVEEELKEIPSELRDKDLKDRKDLRDLTIFTIDGDDTKDIDDAISIKKLKNGNYELGVHIADVSYYVKENSPLDKEAFQRGTSVYLTDRVIPMLPHQLSNGICSLNPNVDRLAVSCVMEVDQKGNVTKYDIFPSVIRSRIQMTYKHVNEWLEQGIVADGYKDFTDDLSLMNELSKIIRNNKIRRGCIDFDTDEAKILIDETGHPIDIVKRERGTGEKLIEDFMIIANETVASHMFYMELPAIYRVHGDPSEERLMKFLETLNTIGITIKADLKKMSPFVVQKIINELKKHNEFKVLSTSMLSCMDKAIYDTDNIGHFGIASKCYTHFTSPIRRYPDTTTHRLLHKYFFDPDGITDEKVRHFTEILPEICEHSSERERASVECEREVEDMKMAEYMADHIGEVYNGMISGVTSFGFFVQLDNLIEGLVPTLSLDGYYFYDQNREMLISENKKKQYRLGMEVKVKVVSASKEESKIDFELVEDDKVEKEENKEN